MTAQRFERMIEGFLLAVRQQSPPRNLENPILFNFPLAVCKIPCMCVAEVNAWLRRRWISFQLSSPERPLRGCVLASAGRGVILINGGDPEDEQRVTLAHEASHFIVDYLSPRHRAIICIGQGIVEVLDGLRPPTSTERTDAVLNGVPIGLFTHLLDRGSDGLPEFSRTLASESRADRLALDLLAPVVEVRRQIARVAPSSRFQDRVDVTIGILKKNFGLPDAVANLYGRSLCRSWFGGPSFREWLGIE
jgi:hypothetical protein